jgi:hypothetical protein
MVFILKSWKKEKETNIFIIQCARFAKRSLLILTNSVSILIRLTGRKILAHNKNYHLRQHISESVSKQILHTISLGYYSVHLPYSAFELASFSSPDFVLYFCNTLVVKISSSIFFMNLTSSIKARLSLLLITLVTVY